MNKKECEKVNNFLGSIILSLTCSSLLSYILCHAI